MCGSGAEFQAGGDVEKYSGAVRGGVEEQGGTVDGGGWLALSSEVGIFGGFLGKPGCIELGIRRQVCQILDDCVYERFWDV